MSLEIRFEPLIVVCKVMTKSVLRLYFSLFYYMLTFPGISAAKFLSAVCCVES